MLSRVDFFKNAGLLFSCGQTKTDLEVFKYNDIIDQVQSIPIQHGGPLVSLLLGLL